MKNWFELIEKYIDNELNANERKEVEQLVETNAEFAKEFKLRSDVNKAIAEKDIMKLRRSLVEIHRNIKRIIFV